VIDVDSFIGEVHGYQKQGAGNGKPEGEWAGQDSNLRPTDYESAALTAELPARRAETRLPTSLGGRRMVDELPNHPHPRALSRSPLYPRATRERALVISRSPGSRGARLRPGQLGGSPVAGGFVTAAGGGRRVLS
jgi:hypothetical protein